jgi:hypothetical protein
MKSKLISKFIKVVGKKHVVDGALITASRVIMSSAEMSLVIYHTLEPAENAILPTVVSVNDALEHGADIVAMYPNLDTSIEPVVNLTTRIDTIIDNAPASAMICEVDAATLFNKKHLIAMGKRDVRFYLNGQYTQFKDNCIKVAVSDGYHLVTDSIDAKCKNLVDVIIPRDAVELLSTVEGTVRIHARCTKDGELSCLEFCGQDFTLYVTPYNSKYPNFDKLLHSYVNNKLTTVTVKRNEMLKGLKANLSNLLSVDKSKGVTVILDGNDLIFRDIADPEMKLLFSTKANHDNNNKGIQVVGKFECDYLIDLLTIEKANDIEILFTETCAVIEKANGVNIVMGRRD